MRTFLLICLSFYALFAEDTIRVSYYVDVTNKATIDEITSLDKENFIPLISHKFWTTNESYWLYIEVNQANKNRVFEFVDTSIDSISIYDEKAQELAHIGDKEAFTNNLYDTPKFSFLLKNDVYYLKVQNSNLMHLDFKLFDEKMYEKQAETLLLLKSFYFGMLLVILLYNVIVYLYIREKVFLYYVLYHIFLAVAVLYHYGTIAQVVFPETKGLNYGNIPASLIGISTLFSILFASSYLQTQKKVPRLHRLFYGLILLDILGIIMAYIPSLYVINNHYVGILSATQSIFMWLVSGYMSFKLKDKVARLYFIFFFIMMWAVVISVLTGLDLIPRYDWVEHTFALAVLFEMSFLSLALAYRYTLSLNDLEEKRRILQEQSKLASMGEMLRHITHQWRQPLCEINSVVMNIERQYLKENLTPKRLDENLNNIENIVQYMSSTIDDFSGYFKQDKVKNETCIETIIEKSLTLIGSSLEKENIALHVKSSDNVMFELYERELIQVLIVLLTNAKDALVLSTHENKEIVIENYYDVDEDKHYLSVQDNGGGIAKENLSKIFEPYFTTKFESQGVGIGLYMSKMIIQESMKGRLSVQNTKVGAKFLIVF